MTVVLDASALLAYLQDEPGSEAVEEVLAESVMPSVNWAEVVQKSVAAGVVVDGMREDLAALGLTIAPFCLQEAEMAGQLWLQTRQAGLSWGDRACLSVGMGLNVPLLTCDRLWQTLGLALDVRVIR
ncbi:PIN domain-containing protein [Gloeocapsopsis dulcis]|uniref:Twitching motility protein PilT n=1 Tax=Gloeocapsopsis dulcis AAB1 = 1H9 TaxID=1433147 RepID=A0A6N8FRY6_9CHRO|nr:type II toxin-antitoxin system VapC family toxin [Gloeocapsopsis dulcis]MUL34957.1 twitching motility protein PilT [Gloeocapsopsis dulcis AAB1 = 1H9]WNN89973.1 type II toxin-antitoxin system VapC family toxin [Gloeocapsopsis dulcis]